MRKNPQTGLSSKKANKIPELAQYVSSSQASHRILLLPVEYHQKISQLEYKKVREAYFIEANANMNITRHTFPIVIRSLGVVAKSYSLLRIFDQQLKRKQMVWEEFLKYYLQFRNQKGSYNELSGALGSLDKEYSGNWEQLLVDLAQIGDVLTEKQLDKFKKLVLEGKTLNDESILNALLGYQ